MIPFASLGVAKSLAASWWKAGVGAVLIFPLAFGLGQCSGAADQKKREEAARAVAIAEALKTDGASKEKAADERLADAEAVTDLKEELTNAVQDLPDGVPSARRVALACARLRAQGADLSRVPACSGPAGEAQAGARP